MKKDQIIFNIFFVLIILLLLSFQARDVFAETTVSGNVVENSTWTKANSPYKIVDTLQVFNDITLTIEEGVEVRIAGAKLIKIAGTLVVNGTNINPVIFTSLDADKWGGIEFIDSPNSQINNSIIENAGSAVSLQGISVVLMVGNIFKNNVYPRSVTVSSVI
jgi:hypothetical protein